MHSQTTRTKVKATLLTLIVALVLAACGGSDVGGADADKPADGGSGSDSPGSDDALRIAVLLPSAKNDLAFSQSMVDSLEQLGEDHDIEVAYTDNAFVVEDAAAAILDYASSGYQLVIAHGSQYGATIEEIAPDFPEVSFAWGTAVDTFGLPNVFAYEAAADQGGYVQGVMAAAMSTSDVLGIVGPIEVGDAKLYAEGFVAGARAQNPNVDVRVNWIGSFSDVALAAEAAKAFATQGADGLTGTAQMVVGAIGVAEEQGIAWFSSDVDQSSLAKDVVVSGQVYHWEMLLSQILDELEQGTLGGKSYALTLENGGLAIAFNDDYDLPAEVRALGEETRDGIIAGEITTGVSP